MNIVEHNRAAWNLESTDGGEWSRPVDADAVAAARRGQWSVILTPVRTVPRAWFGDLDGLDVLCLASGGGQQAPILAAAGARVTSFDLSDEQLARDEGVAERDGLALRTERGDMADLSRFAAASFDLVFHPVSNLFVPDVDVVWRECFRVLRPGGALLAGFMNPAFFLFDHDLADRTVELRVRYRLPYAEPSSLDADGVKQLEDSGRACEFGHSLETQIGGQLAAGFVLAGLYEDGWTDEATPLNPFMPCAIATRAVKPGL